MPDGLERNEEAQGLPPWPDLPGEQNPTQMDAPPEIGSVEDVLPSPPPEVHDNIKPKRKRDHRRIKAKHVPGFRTQRQDYLEWRRLQRKKQEENKKNLNRPYDDQVQHENAINDQRYKFSKSWLTRKLGPNKDQLERWIEGNAELNKLRKQLSIPYKKRRALLRDQLRERLLVKLFEKHAALQAEIQPLITKVTALGTQMRAVLKQIDFAKFRIRSAHPATDSELREEIDLKVKEVTYRMSSQLWRNEKIRIAELHGFHGYLNRKYRMPDIVLNESEVPIKQSMFDKNGKRFMRRRRDRKMKLIQKQKEANEHPTE